jgi:formylglycine-generating enzyme required for sulfatase activity
MRVFISVLAFAIIAGLIGWLKQDYLRDQVRIRPYIETQVRPYVLSAAAERALEPGNSFKECAKNCPEMVVVPAGQFVMGSSTIEKGRFRNEGPQHTVYLDAYWIDQTEVTQEMYAQCMAAGQCNQPSGGNKGDGYPVTGVSWLDAKTIAPGRDDNCQPKPNGRRRRVGRMAGYIRGGIYLPRVNML